MKITTANRMIITGCMKCPLVDYSQIVISLCLFFPRIMNSSCYLTCKTTTFFDFILLCTVNKLGINCTIFSQKNCRKRRLFLRLSLGGARVAQTISYNPQVICPPSLIQDGRGSGSPSLRWILVHTGSGVKPGLVHTGSSWPLVMATANPRICGVCRLDMGASRLYVDLRRKFRGEGGGRKKTQRFSPNFLPKFAKTMFFEVP